MTTSSTRWPEGMSVGIVGATGLVGEFMRAILAQREFPVRSLRLFQAGALRGQAPAPWQGGEIAVEDAATADYAGLDVVFFSAGGETARALAPIVAAAGAIVIDNSLRLARRSGRAARGGGSQSACPLRTIPKGIVANPNRTTMPAMPVPKVLHDLAGLKRLVASTYQAVSGGGVAGVDELERQLRAVGANAAKLVRDGAGVDCPTPVKWAVAMACNVGPVNYRVVGGGYTVEELAPGDESRKSLELPGLPVSATCVRVPVFTGHSVSINAEFERPLSAPAAQAALSHAAGVVVTDVPNPLQATGRDAVFVGRIRKDPTVEHGLALFVSADNLRQGAALNAVQIAEALLRQSR